MQVIYSGKTKASQPRDFKFPSGFCVTQNPKHWSNEIETLKLIDEIISPYVTKKREDLKLAKDQKALLIEYVYVPANMTQFFQPLDLTVNGCAKQRMKKEFCYILFECCKATA